MPLGRASGVWPLIEDLWVAVTPDWDKPKVQRIMDRGRQTAEGEERGVERWRWKLAGELEQKCVEVRGLRAALGQARAGLPVRYPEGWESWGHEGYPAELEEEDYSGEEEEGWS